MEPVNNTPVGKPVQIEYGGKTFTVENISHLLTVGDTKPDAGHDMVDADDWKRNSPDFFTPAQNRAFYSRLFTDGTLANNLTSCDAYSKLTHQADCAIGSFLDGNLSKEELSDQFESMLDGLSTTAARLVIPIRSCAVPSGWSSPRQNPFTKKCAIRFFNSP